MCVIIDYAYYKMKKYILFNSKNLIILLLILICSLVNAQKSNKNLLQLINNKSTTEIQKSNYFGELSLNFAQSDSAKAFLYANKALKIARNLNSKKQQVIVYDYLRTIASNNDDNPKLVKYANLCYSLANKTNDDEAKAYGDYSIALKYDMIGESEKYVAFMLKSLAYFEKNKLRYDKLVNGYENLGASFADNSNNPKATEKYIRKTLDLAFESKNKIHIANGLTSWGVFLVHKFENTNSQNQKLLDSASNCYQKAIKIFEASNATSNYSYGRTYLNLSSLYMYHFFETQQNKVIELLKKTENVCLKINSPKQLMILYGQQTQFYTNKNDIPNIVLALAKLEKCIDKQTSIEPRYKMLLYKNYMGLATLRNDFPSYRKYFDLYDNAIAEMIDKENRTKEFNATIKFETDQKDREIQSLSENLQAKKKINYLYGTLFILTLISLLFMFRSYHFRQKSYIKANLLLQKANQEANLLSKLKEEEAMNSMLEAELSEKELQIAIQEKLLTEQQKTKLQQELMTNNLQLEKKNEVLKDIQEKLLVLKSNEKSEIKKITKAIDKSLEVDDEFELLKTSFENTNPVFLLLCKKKL